MAELTPEALLAQLAGNGAAGQQAWTAVRATTPVHAAPRDEKKLAGALERIQSLTGGVKDAPSPLQSQAAVEDFLPPEPKTFREAGLTDSEVESLVLKYLLSRGEASGREVADQVKLPFVLIEPLLRQMKHDQVVAHRGAAPMNDYVFQLGEIGRERARRYSEHCTYYGAAPVSLRD
jgi:hypothetical protein